MSRSRGRAGKSMASKNRLRKHEADNRVLMLHGLEPTPRLAKPKHIRVLRGRQKIESLVARGIKNPRWNKTFFRKPLAVAVRNALSGGLFS